MTVFRAGAYTIPSHAVALLFARKAKDLDEAEPAERAPAYARPEPEEPDEEPEEDEPEPRHIDDEPDETDDDEEE